MQQINKEVVEVTSKLISFQTTIDRLQEKSNCIDYIQGYFSGTKLIVKKFVSNGIPSLIISNQSTKSFDLLFNGHIDVVPGAKKQFNSKVTSSRIFGRGAIDMKGSVASLMVLFRTLPKTNKKVGLMIVSDEEVDGSNGTKYILNKKGIKSKFAIIAEESGFDIVAKQKGQATIKLSTTGKSGHGSQPWTGDNAAEKLINYYLEIRKIFPKEQSNVWNSNSINLGVISGGNTANVIPSYAEAKVDIRYPTKVKLEAFMGKLTRLRQEGFEFSIISKTNPMSSGNSLAYINKLKPIIKSKLNRTPKIKWTNYCSDGRYFSDNKLPVIEFGPIGANYHSDDEYVDIQSLENYVEILNRFIETL